MCAEHQQSGRSGFTIVRYGPGESVPQRAIAEQATASPAALPGDFLLTHSRGLVSSLIRVGQRIRYWGEESKYAHWSHAAVFVDDRGNIVEALGAGVQQRHISVYDKTEYVVVHLPQGTFAGDREQAVQFALHCLNDDYGWLTIASIALGLLTGSIVNFNIDGQQICSALVARALERTGEIFSENEPWHLMPADLAKHFAVNVTGQIGTIPGRAVGLQRASRPGRRHVGEQAYAVGSGSRR